MNGINGGIFEGKNYSCMFSATEKQLSTSPNKQFYFQCGELEGKGLIDAQPAILIFDMEDKLVYAEPMATYGDYRNTIKRLMSELSFFAEVKDIYTLPFGTKINVVWNDGRHFNGVLFGGHIGWEDGLIDNQKMIRECMLKGICKVYII